MLNAVMAVVYEDSQFSITKHTHRSDTLIRVNNSEPGLLNTDQAQFMIYRTGRVIGYDIEGNIFVTRNAGDTTDSSAVELPDQGVMSVDANSEFYCITKKSKNNITREIVNACSRTVGKAGVLCVMKGSLTVKTQELVDDHCTVTAPMFVSVSETDQITNTSKTLWAILVS